ncbi:MAG: transporter [Gammaproteobacteria bacterium]|nr:transporter [Gammaproteobacteria bacterium]
MRLFSTGIIATFILVIDITSAQAAEGGYSNYIPGTYGDFAAAVEPPTKLTIRNDVYHYQAEANKSVRAGLIEADVDLELNIDLLTILYKPDVKVLSANYGFGALVPMVHTDIDAGVSAGGFSVRRQDDVVGVGDIVLIPGILFWNSGNYHFTLAEYVVTPTANYDENDLANAGLNYWTFDTNFAVTYLNEQTGQDYSINIGYSYNTENSDTDYQTGQEIHIDYMINQFLSERWAIGIAGYYLKQVTGDSGDGAFLGDFKAEAAGIGPALLWNTKVGNQEISFIAKWIHDYHAENRLEGDHLFLSFAMSF